MEKNGKKDDKKTVYRKLVRDRIPQIIEEDGKRCVFRVLGEEEYLKCLDGKLLEECREYLESGDAEEICDILEVLHSILAAKGITAEEIEKTRLKKREARGGFEKRIFLETVETEEKTEDAE